MAKQTINHGTTAGDKTGESLFSAFQKTNANFTELYGAKTEFVANAAALPATGEAGKIYVTADNGVQYRWNWVSYQRLRSVAKVFTGTGGTFGGTGTTIPTSSNPIGDYTTKLLFQGLVRDDLGSVVDMANSRLVVPAGFSECRLTYNLAWGVSGTSSFTANTAAGSAILTNASSVAALGIGAPVSGAGIPTGAQIIGISGTSVYLNMAATATASGVTVTVTNAALGFRGMRIKNNAGNNYGNVRIPAIAAANATTNNNYTSPWISIVSSGGAAPDSINVGDAFTFYPAQTSGADQLAGADLASSFIQLELR